MHICCSFGFFPIFICNIDEKCVNLQNLSFCLQIMRILLLGEASFVHSILRKGFEALGHDVVLMPIERMFIFS